MMTIYEWKEGLTNEQMKDGAYWERNMLALKYADGWYYDYVLIKQASVVGSKMGPRYQGWSRVLSLENGHLTFHIPDDFEVGNLPQIERNWDGHSTKEKWSRIMEAREVGK